MNDILNNTTDYNLVSAAPSSVDETFRYMPTQAPEWREMPKVDNTKWDRLVNGALAGVDEDARAELGDDVLASDYAVQDKDGGNYLLGAEYAEMVGGNAYEAAEQLIAKLPEEEREAAMARLNSCNSEGDGVRLLGELFRGQVRKEWGKQELLAEERVKEMSGLLRDIVLTGDGKNKNGEGWVKFFDGKSRGVWSEKDEQSVARAAEAFSMFEGMVKEYEDASANVLTKASTGRLMLDYLRGDELAEALFFSAVQEKVSDMKADAEERNAFVRFAKLFQSKRQELGASLMGGHFVPFVTDEQVERFNAELPNMRKRAEEAAMHAGPLAAERSAVTGFAVSDAEFEEMRSAALASGQLNEDGSLRKMTDEERARSQEQDEFRGKLHNAVQGAYDLSGVAATLGKMMPSSLVYLAPYGFVPGFMSARTLNLAQQLGEGETWTRANVTATTDAMIQAAVEKLAFGSLNPTKWVTGLDWLMSRPVVNRMLGRVYGTTAGRVGMNVAGGVVEESIGEPLAGLLLSGVYNAAAAAEFRLEDPMGDFYEEIGEMLQPDQLLATALYGLLLGGINWHGHATAARDYREVFAKLVEMGNTPEAAGAMARNDDFVATFKATKKLFEETLKEDAGRVLDYLAELYPQLQGMSAIENYYQRRLLPKLLPAENGQVRVQELDEDGNVSEVLMEEGAARLLVAARMESLEASELHKLADWVLGNAMVGTISKDNKRWIISEEAETMDADYFMRLARAAGVRLNKGAKAEDIDPEVHPHIPLGQLAQNGKAWETRMSIVRNKLDRERKKKGLEPMTEAEWAERKKKFYSQVNRVGVRQQDGSVRTVLRVARGGFGALEALEDITEDNLVRDMSVTGRDLEWYIHNLTELEIALGRQGEFLKPLAKGEKREALDVVEAISEIVKAKVLDDTARPNNGLSAALNAFLDMLRGWFANAMAIMRLGAEVNKVLKDEKAREKMSPEFVQLVEDLARQDVEFLQELQLKEGLEAMQRVRENTSAVLSGMKAGNDTPIVDEAKKKHGKKVRQARKKRMKQQRKVDADVAAAEAALNGDFSASVVNQEELDAIKAAAEKDGTFLKAPNGKHTNLTEQQWLQVRTEAFKAWFGDWEKDPANASKVVDENGEPKVVYHGSRRFGFSNFREMGDSFVIGQFFSESLNVAQSYSDENGVTRIYAKDDPNYSVEFTREFGGYNVGGNYAVFLNVRNPLVFDAKGMPYNNLRDENGNRISTDELAGKGRNAGFDGVIVNKVQDAGAYANMQGDWIDSYTATDYISFNPNQIKSATDNRGTFDGDEADITMSVTDAQEQGLFKDGVLEAGNAVVTEPSFSIEALHVTPHKFRKFSTDFMGAGEGQQAFGWGLYFMTNKEVNQSYYEGFAEYGDVANLRVELNVDDSNLLMWDEVVPAELHDAVRELKSGQPARGLVMQMPEASKECWEGYRIYSELTSALGNPKAASEWLAERGYKGIKYLDGVSRRNGEGTYNYVIFSGDDVKITGVNETGYYDAPWEDYVDETASFSVREKEAPKKTGIGYKVFYQKDGKLYPPMVANPGGADTPVGVWLDADEAPRGEDSKTGRPRVQAGGKGTNAGKQLLAYRPGWHLGKIPYAIQFNRKNPLTGERDLFPKDFVWAEVEYAADEDYQAEVDASDKRHSYRGLQRVPEDGFYEYRTNPDPKTDPWIIAGSMKVNKVLSRAEVDELVRAAGREPQKVQGDEIEVLESLSVADREIEEYRDNTIEFNVVSATDEDTRAYQRLHMRANGLTEEKIEGYFALMDKMVSDVLEISKDIPEFKEWQERAVYYYFEQGGKLPRLAPSVSALKKNGDYPVNFDLGTLCVKREMMTLLTDKLIAMGYADRLGVSQLQQLKEILREAGISVACDICFVEARRVRALQQAQQLAYYWNAVRATAGIETNAPIGFAEELTDEQIDKLERMADTENADKVLQEMVAEKYRRREDYDLGLSTKAMTLIAKIFLQDNSMAGEASLNDFMSASKVDFMLRQYPHTNIRSLLASAFGAGTGKPLEDFNVYDGLSWRELKKDNDLDDFRDTTYNIGGARVQSFSDFNPILFLDYYQMMFDLAWRQMPLQSYTKVTSFVELFGHCGIKINMSLIPDVVDGVDPDHAGLEKDKNGNWVYAWHKDSFPIKLAYQYREMDEYHKNVGIVAVGISREHVRMLLRDGKIDYVIPFHRSGMPTTIMISTGLDKATDFSDVQLTRKLTEEEDKKTKKKKLKLTKADDTFSFNQEMRRLGDPKLAAKAYLEYCDENGFVPKFDEFRDEENYYKLLVDFRVYDKHGEYAPQGPVTTDMPEDWAARLEKALGSRVKEQRKMERLLEDSGVLAKAEAVMKQTPLEGALRKVMLERLNDALRNGPKGGKNKVADPVHLMKASEFQAKLRELSMANMDQSDEAKFSEMFRTQKGHIYGFSYRGEIYLAENMFNAHTPAHEFVHVWTKVAQQFAPELWAKGVKLLKKTAEWDNVLTDPFYWNIHGNDDAVASEVMARMVGYRVEEMVREVTDPKQKALTEKGLGEKIREWAKALWTKVRSLFDAPDGKPLTLKEFIQMPLADLWDKSRNKKFNSHVRKMLKKTPEQREQVAMTNMASMSISDMEEEDVGKAIAAAGNGFKANQAFAEQMLKEIRSSLARMKRLGSKSRTEREEAIAAMGGINHMVKALVQYLPKGYRFSVHPYMNKLDVLTELATTGNVEMMRENVSKGLQEWMDETSETWHDVLPTLSGNENLSREELTGLVQDIIKEHAGMKLTDAVEAIVNRVAEQLRRHARDKAVQKMHELLDATLPKKDAKTGKMKGGKMSADDYRDLEIVKEALGLNSDKLKAVMAALKEQMKSPDLSEEARDAIESELTIYDQFGDPKSMGAEEAVAAYEALRQRIWMNRFAWDNIMSERRAARRAMVRSVVDGVGSVSQNEYNAKKRRVKPIKRMKNLADILSGMPAAVEALSGYLPLRELAKSLTTRANIAGELIKQWEAERWLALEELSLETLGRSWRECMSFMHEVLPTGVSFDMPTYRNVDIKVSALRSLLEMGKKERLAEMERRRKEGGKMAETALWESDIEAAARELQRMEENGEVKTWIHVRYQSGVQHEENLRLSRGEALYAILMYEQPRYTEKLQAQGYTPEVIAGLKEFIGDGMLQFGYGLRELFRIQGDKIAVVYERAFGVPFYREENYFAARWDVSEMKENSAEQLLAGMAGTTGAGNGWMKQRVDHNLDLDMTKDALEVFLQATSLTDTWMATQDIVADFKAWTREKEFGRAMTALIGEDSYNNLKDWIRILEQGGVQDCLNMGVAQDVINGIYGSGAVAILGLRVQTLIRQVPAVFNGLLGAHDISSGEWLMALATMKKGDAPMTFSRMVNSVLMKNRQQGKAGLMASQAMRSGDSASSSAEEFLLASMLPMEWMDARCTALSLVPVWNVYYQRAVKKGASHKEAEKIAWDETTVVANLSSQPIGLLNKSKVEQNRHPIVKSLFYMLSENTSKFALCHALARSGKKKAAVRAWLIYGAANAAISALLDWLQGDPDEWEKGNWWEYLLSALYGPLASLPGVGELVEALGTMLVNAAGHAWDIEAAKKAKTHASVGRALIDLQGSYKAVRKIIEFATDDEEHSLAEYTRAASTVSRTVAIGTGWMGTAFGYWSTVAAVVMNPIDFGARVWRNMQQYYAEE